MAAQQTQQGQQAQQQQNEPEALKGTEQAERTRDVVAGASFDNDSRGAPAAQNLNAASPSSGGAPPLPAAGNSDPSALYAASSPTAAAANPERPAGQAPTSPDVDTALRQTAQASEAARGMARNAGVDPNNVRITGKDWRTIDARAAQIEDRRRQGIEVNGHDGKPIPADADAREVARREILGLRFGGAQAAERVQQAFGNAPQAERDRIAPANDPQKVDRAKAYEAALGGAAGAIGAGIGRAAARPAAAPSQAARAVETHARPAATQPQQPLLTQPPRTSPTVPELVANPRPGFDPAKPRTAQLGVDGPMNNPSGSPYIQGARNPLPNLEVARSATESWARRMTGDPNAKLEVLRGTPGSGGNVIEGVVRGDRAYAIRHSADELAGNKGAPHVSMEVYARPAGAGPNFSRHWPRIENSHVAIGN